MLAELSKFAKTVGGDLTKYVVVATYDNKAIVTNDGEREEWHKVFTPNDRRPAVGEILIIDGAAYRKERALVNKEIKYAQG